MYQIKIKDKNVTILIDLFVKFEKSTDIRLCWHEASKTVLSNNVTADGGHCRRNQLIIY